MKKDGTLKSISEKWLGMNVSVPNNQENSNNIIDNNKNNSIGFDFMYSLDLIPMLLKAINVTISLSVFGMILGLIVGIALAMIRVLNTISKQLRIRDLEKYNRINLHRNVIFRDNRLRCKIYNLLF